MSESLSARAAAASRNDIFQLKMLLLGTAAAFHFAVVRRAARQSRIASVPLRFIGGTGFALWLGVTLAGCAYILLE